MSTNYYVVTKTLIGKRAGIGDGECEFIVANDPPAESYIEDSSGTRYTSAQFTRHIRETCIRKVASRILGSFT